MTAPPLVLASGSPRRARLLEQLGLTFEVVPAALDEAALPGEAAESHVRRLALEKARAVAAERPGSLVVAGDTVVTVGSDLLGKPRDETEALAMLLRLAGREHRVQSGVAAVAPDGREAVEVVGADVRFRDFGRDVAERYVATGEPLDKAGAYGIQERGAVLVESLTGDYFAVMGLPLAGLVEILETLGYGYRFRDGIEAISTR